LRRSKRRLSGVGLPDALTPAALAVCVWVAAASRKPWTGIVPAALAAIFLVWDYGLWRRRGAPWHDPAVIALGLPALACGLWIGVSGIALDVDRGAAGRIALEVGPGLALTGLICTLAGYYGRHRP
jgi:hypothetical protein